MNNNGLPVCRDLFDLYTAMVLSLSERWTDWRYMLAFALSAGVQRVQALQLVQIEREKAEGDHMLSLSQTKTLFTMDVEMAERVCQAFVDAALLARLPHEEDDVYSPTPKGLHVVDRFVTRHGVATDAATNLLSVHPICDKLLYLERDEHDDLFLSDAVVRIVFQRMVGLMPHRDEDSSLGMALGPELEFIDDLGTFKTGSFDAAHALNWLLHFSSLVSSEEASTIAAHMVRLGWIAPNGTIAPDTSAYVSTVRVDTSEGTQYGTFVYGETYHVTRLGTTIAWQEHMSQAETENNARGSEDADMGAAATDAGMGAPDAGAGRGTGAQSETGAGVGAAGAGFAAGAAAGAAFTAANTGQTPHKAPSTERTAMKLIEARENPSSSPRKPNEEPRPSTPRMGAAATKAAPSESAVPPSTPRTTGSIRANPSLLRSPSGSSWMHSQRSPSGLSWSQQAQNRSPSGPLRDGGFNGSPNTSGGWSARSRPTSFAMPAASVYDDIKTPTPNDPVVPPASDVFRSATVKEPAAARGTPAAAQSFATPAAGSQTNSSQQNNIAALAQILHTSAKRKAYLRYLDEVSTSIPLHFWCEIERFRSRCRLASNGLLEDSDNEDDAVQDMTAVFNTGHGGPPDTPRRRAAQRPLLSRNALRLELFLAPGSEDDLGLSEELVDELKVALARYAKREYSIPGRLAQISPEQVSAEAARESETQLASLLLVCAQAQKQVFKNLADARLEGFLASHGR